METWKRSFRDWVIPGAIPPGSITGEPPLREGETLDALCGHFRIFQLAKGHRFSTDDVLAAWYGTSWAPTTSNILDLGCGLGTVGIMAAWRLTGAQVVGVEAQEQSFHLAQRSVRWNGLDERIQLRLGDFRDPGVIGAEEKFDLIFGTPPYFPLGTGVEGDHEQKVACRFEVRGDITDYCKIAARYLKPGGWFTCVFPMSPPEQLQRVIEGAKAADLVIVRRRPVVLREPERPLLSLFAMLRKEDVPVSVQSDTWVEPALVIRREDGNIHPEYARVKLSFGFPP